MVIDRTSEWRKKGMRILIDQPGMPERGLQRLLQHEKMQLKRSQGSFYWELSGLKAEVDMPLAACGETEALAAAP